MEVLATKSWVFSTIMAIMETANRSSSVPPENENGRPLTPIEFHHISSGLESAGAVEERPICI